MLHGVYPETLHFVQSDNRRVQHDKKSVILSASEESHSFQCHSVYFVCIRQDVIPEIPDLHPLHTRA